MAADGGIRVVLWVDSNTYVRSPGPGITEVGPEGLSCQISGLLLNRFWVDSSLTLRYGHRERQVALLLAKMPLALWWERRG